MADTRSTNDDAFDVFLCHNSQDKPVVKEFGEKLKTQGLRPWLDEWELRPGLPWQRLLEQQIDSIRSAAVFVGKDGIGPWQHIELESFLRQFVNRGVPVIPVLLENAPEEPELPVFLSNMTWVDFRKSAPDSMEQLIWGITGKRSSEQRSANSDGESMIPVVSGPKMQTEEEASTAHQAGRNAWRSILLAIVLVAIISTALAMSGVLQGWFRAPGGRPSTSTNPRPPEPGESSKQEISLRLFLAAQKTKDPKLKSLLLANAMSHSAAPFPDAQKELQLALEGVPVHRFEKVVEPLSCAFSLDGSTFAAGSGGDVHVFDLETGKKSRFMKMNAALGRAIALSHDAKYVASVSGNKVYAWDCRKPKEDKEFRAEALWQVQNADSDLVNQTIAFAADGGLLIVMSDGSLVKLDMVTGTKQTVIPAAGVLAVSPNGGYVAVRSIETGESRSYVFKETVSGREVSRIPVAAFSSQIRFSANGDFVIFRTRTSNPEKLVVWDVINGRILNGPPKASMIESVEGTEWHFKRMNVAPDARHISYVGGKKSGGDGIGFVCRINSQVDLQKRSEVHFIDFSPNGKLIAVSDWHHQVKIESLFKPAQTSVMWHNDHHSQVSVNGNAHVTAVGKARVTRWDMNSGVQIDSWQASGEVIALSPDGEHIATLTEENTVTVAKTLGGGEATPLPHDETVLCAAFSGSGQKIAVLTGNRKVEDMRRTRSTESSRTMIANLRVKVWDLLTRSPPKEVILPTAGNRLNDESELRILFAVALSRNGRYVYFGGIGQPGAVANLGEIEAATEFTPLADGFPVAFAYHDELMATLPDHAEGAIVISHVGGASRVASLQVDGHVKAAAFSSDGQLIGAACGDGTLRVWNIKTETEIARLHDPSAQSLAFSFDNDHLVAAGGADIRVWQWQPGYLIDVARNRLRSLELTNTQWGEHVGTGIPYEDRVTSSD